MYRILRSDLPADDKKHQLDAALEIPDVRNNSEIKDILDNLRSLITSLIQSSVADTSSYEVISNDPQFAAFARFACGLPTAASIIITPSEARDTAPGGADSAAESEEAVQASGLRRRLIPAS